MTHHANPRNPDPDAVVGAVWPVDGPYSVGRTVSAARAAGELVRYLNYATRGACGLPEPADVYELVGAVRVLVDRLPQALAQTGARFAELAGAPNAALTSSAWAHLGDPDRPAAATRLVRAELAEAGRLLAEVSARLNAAQVLAGRLYLAEEG